MELKKSDTVRELVDLFNAGIIKYQDIQDLFSVSRDLIKARLSGIGLQWDNSQKKMIGEATEDNINKPLLQLFEKQRGRNQFSQSPKVSDKTGIETGTSKGAGNGSEAGNIAGGDASEETGTGDAFKEVATTLQAGLNTGTSTGAGKKTSKGAGKQTGNNTRKEADILDRLFEGSPATNDKKEVSFYLTHDVISVINKAKKGNRSDLVNEALRKVFREKGWL